MKKILRKGKRSRENNCKKSVTHTDTEEENLLKTKNIKIKWVQNK